MIASSTLPIDVRSRERRDLLISVRRAITRVAFLADLVLAMSLSYYETRVSKRKAAKTSPPPARLIGGPRLGVNAGH